MIKAKFQFNWLWKLAIFFYCQFLLCQLFINSDNTYGIKFTENTFISPFVFLLVFILMPPIIEELIFRGVYRNNRVTVIFSIVFYLGSNLMLFNTGISFWWIFLILTPAVILLAIRNNNDTYKILIIVYSTLLFTLAHFNNESTFQDFVLRSGNYIGAGFFLSWIAINFTLFKSILFHLIYNILVFFVFIFFSDKIFVKNETGSNIVYEVKEVSFFNRSRSILRTPNTFFAEQTSLSMILSHLEITNSSNIYIDTPVAKYNISITDKVDDLQNEEILQILIDSGVIQVR